MTIPGTMPGISIDVPNRICKRFKVSCVAKSFLSIGGIGSRGSVFCLDPLGNILVSAMMPPKMLRIPTRIVSTDTRIPGIMHEMAPKTANKIPSPIMGQVRGKGPIGVFPNASI